MKTKIIYISGAEKFNIADVRAAFDSVRDEIGLDSDTIMFGVPVDSDDVSNGKFASVAQITEPEPEPVIEQITEPEPVAEPVSEEPEPKPAKRGRKKAIKNIEPEPESIADFEPEQIIEPEPEFEHKSESDAEHENNDEPIVPILSVLSETKNDDTVEVSEPDIVIETSDVSVSDDDVEIHSEKITINDILSDDVPDEISDTEKTLEELLESMTPLSEDVQPDAQQNFEADAATDDAVISDDAEDEALRQLATEFLETQDKLINTTKSSSRSKIGKLKNILPFKKAKHEDGGLMGDLFGWAGVAANDEDFSMPGFLDLSPKK